MVFCKNVRTSVLFVQKCVKKCAFLYPTQLVGKGVRGPPKVGGENTEDRIQEAEDGSQKAEGGGRKAAWAEGYPTESKGRKGINHKFHELTRRRGGLSGEQGSRRFSLIIDY